MENAVTSDAIVSLLNVAVLATVLGLLSRLALRFRGRGRGTPSPGGRAPLDAALARWAPRGCWIALGLAFAYCAADLWLRAATAESPAPGSSLLGTLQGALQGALIWALVLALAACACAGPRSISAADASEPTPEPEPAASLPSADRTAWTEPRHELNNLLAVLAWNCEALRGERESDPRIAGIQSATARVIELTRKAPGPASGTRTAPPARAPLGAGADDPLRGATLLVVDDEAAIRRLIRTALERAGCSVREAVTGAQAVELATDPAQPLGAVLTDVRVPGLSGLELAAELRKERPDLPVVYMSGYDVDTLGRGELLDPRSRFLPKPFAMQQALDLLRDLLRTDGRADSNPALRREARIR